MIAERTHQPRIVPVGGIAGWNFVIIPWVFDVLDVEVEGAEVLQLVEIKYHVSAVAVRFPMMQTT